MLKRLPLASSKCMTIVACYQCSWEATRDDLKVLALRGFSGAKGKHFLELSRICVPSC